MMDVTNGSIAVRSGDAARRWRVLFVVSRERPDRFDSLARAFAGDQDVSVIFDRRREERRQHRRPIAHDRRRQERRSDLRASALRLRGWIRVVSADSAVAKRFNEALRRRP
jgi:hypothetical protein